VSCPPRLRVVAVGALFCLIGAACASAASHPRSAGPSAAVKPKAVSTTSTGSTLPPPLTPGANTLLVLGDSVILGAQTQIQTSLVGWDLTFDAKVSRSIYAGVSILQTRTGPPPRVVVVHLCTNWGATDFGHQIDRVMATLTGVERVVWVTCTPWTPRVLDADAAIGAASVRYHNVVIADWEPISLTAGYTYADHLHLRTPGAQAMADLLARVIGPSPNATSTSTSSATAPRGTSTSAAAPSSR
jgi:hypothetical protein